MKALTDAYQQGAVVTDQNGTPIDQPKRQIGFSGSRRTFDDHSPAVDGYGRRVQRFRRWLAQIGNPLAGIDRGQPDNEAGTAQLVVT